MSLVHVAVGVIVGKDGRILIARRPQNTHQGGLWEFPGGKLAEAEDVHQALVRELHEELAIDVIASEPLIQIRHDYGDKQVLLDVRRVTRFDGEPCGAEGQPIHWVAVEQLRDYAFPAANRPIITALRLPQKMLITGAAGSQDEYLQRARRALDNGIRCVQLRCPDMPDDDYRHLAGAMQALCNAKGAQLILNTSPHVFASIPDADPVPGLHLNRHYLMALETRPVADDVVLGASCHSAEELDQAVKLGVDYVTLSPVAMTQSHPDAEPLGWMAFAALVAGVPVPVYALGGMNETDLPQALASGAQGIAAIGCWWE